MRPMGDITSEHIENEIRAAVKLCRPGAHNNIVAVLDIGEIPMTSFFFLDMELCDLSLDAYIYQRWTARIRDKVPAFVRESPLEQVTEVGQIMTDMTNAVEYIHSHGEIHRDLKPHNSIIPVRL